MDTAMPPAVPWCSPVRKTPREFTSSRGRRAPDLPPWTAFWSRAASRRSPKGAEGVLPGSGDASATRDCPKAAAWAGRDVVLRPGDRGRGATISKPGETMFSCGKPGRSGDADFSPRAHDPRLHATGDPRTRWHYRRIGPAVGRNRRYRGHHRGFGSGPALRLILCGSLAPDRIG